MSESTPRTDVGEIEARLQRLKTRRKRQNHQVTQQAETIRRLQKEVDRLEAHLQSISELLEDYEGQMSPDAYADLNRQTLKALEGGPEQNEQVDPEQ